MPQPKTDKVVHFDVEYFDSLLNRPDIPEAQRHAALKELWNLIGMFIDVGWGVYPLPQPVPENGGKLASSFGESNNLSSDLVKSEHHEIVQAFIGSTDLKGALNGSESKRN